MIFFLLIIFLIQSTYISSSSSHQVCVLSRENNKTMDEKEIKCPTNNCEKKYSFKCSSKHCTTNETICIMYVKSLLTQIQSSSISSNNEAIAICRNGKNCLKKIRFDRLSFLNSCSLILNKKINYYIIISLFYFKI